MSKKNKRALRYIEKPDKSSLPKPISLSESIQDLPKYYNSIHALPLCRFIDAIVDGNIFSLVISGTPELPILQTTWEKIREQYADKMGDMEYKLYASLYREINELTANINSIHVLVDQLRMRYVKKFADRLNSLLITNYKFDITDLAEYDKLLDRCYNKTGGLQLNLDLKLINFKAIEEKNKEKNTKPTRDYYASVLITLSDNVGYPLRDDITVFEFCERIIRSQKKPSKSKRNAR